MKILAIDPATKTGWACSTASGVEDFKLRSNESKGMKFVRFKAFLSDLIKKENVDILVYEKPSGRHFNGVRSGANFEGIILTVCEELGIEYRDYSPTEIKRFAKEMYQKIVGLKIGRMNKDAMMLTANKVFRLSVIDDNQADALWLYWLAERELNNKFIGI